MQSLLQLRGVISFLGKLLVILGAILIALGLVFIYLERLRVPYLGRLPGDIRIEREGFTLYFPWVTFLVISLLLTLLLNIVLRFLGR